MKKAFTMIELIFVIVILGILAAIAVPKLGNVKDKAEITKAVTAFSVAISDVMNNYQLNGNKLATDKGEPLNKSKSTLSDETSMLMKNVTHALKEAPGKTAGSVDTDTIVINNVACAKFKLVGSATNNDVVGLQFITLGDPGKKENSAKSLEAVAASHASNACEQFLKHETVKEILGANGIKPATTSEINLNSGKLKGTPSTTAPAEQGAE